MSDDSLLIQHVQLTKPVSRSIPKQIAVQKAYSCTSQATQLLADHQKLIDLAEKNGVLCTVEHHKREHEAPNPSRRDH